MKPIEINGIGNYYGGIQVKEDSGKYFWRIENYCETPFQEIPKSLYDELIKYNQY